MTSAAAAEDVTPGAAGNTQQEVTDSLAVATAGSLRDALALLEVDEVGP